MVTETGHGRSASTTGAAPLGDRATHHAQAPGTAQTMYPPMSPREPVRPAPARFGEAGISAGEEHRFKDTISPHADWSRRPAPDQMARCLGWFSICLGVTEILGGKSLAKWMGVEDQTHLIRGFGVREIATGVGILMQDTPKGHRRWVQGRIAGDALDLAALGGAMFRPEANHGAVAVALAAVAGATAADITCATLLCDR